MNVGIRRLYEAMERTLALPAVPVLNVLTIFYDGLLAPNARHRPAVVDRARPTDVYDPPGGHRDNVPITGYRRSLGGTRRRLIDARGTEINTCERRWC